MTTNSRLMNGKLPTTSLLSSSSSSSPYKPSNRRPNTNDSEREQSMKPLSSYLDGIPQPLISETNEFNAFEFWNSSNEIMDEYTKKIDFAIEEAIDRHHKGFNQATQGFNEILDAFKDSELRLNRLINNLSEAKKIFEQTVGQNGKTKQINHLWNAFENCKKQLKEFDKIEYFSQVPSIYQLYLNNKQYIHATVLLEDSLSLWTTNLSQVLDLQSSHNELLNIKSELENELRQQLFEQIYYKTNELRDYILYYNEKQKKINIYQL